MGWSGKNGKVYIGACTRTADGGYAASGTTTETAEVTEWNAEGKANVQGYGHSGSSGFKVRCVGTAEVTGDFAVKLENSAILAPGHAYQVVLECAAITLSGIAVISGVPIATKIDGGEAVSATYRFESHGSWLYGAGTGDDGNTQP